MEWTPPVVGATKDSGEPPSGSLVRQSRGIDDFAYLNPLAMLPAILDRTVHLGFSMPSEPKIGAMLRVLAAAKPGGRLLVMPKRFHD
jgi:hypothetical protein